MVVGGEAVQLAPVPCLQGEVSPDGGGVHLEVSAPHAGAAETLVQGQQVQAVGVLAPLDLVAGAGLDTGLGRVSTTQGAADLAGQARAPHAGHAAQPRVQGHYHGVDTRLHHLHHLHRQIKV